MRRSRTSHATSWPSGASAAARPWLLPPGDAHVSSTRRPDVAPASSVHELGRLVLHDELLRPSRVRVRSGCPDSTMSASGANVAARASTTPSRASRSDQRIGVTSAAGWPEASAAAGALLNCEPLLGRVEAESLEPPLDQPARMRQRDAQIVERRVAVSARVAGRGGKRQRMRAFARSPRSTRVHQAPRAPLADLSRSFTASSTTAAAGTRVR